MKKRLLSIVLLAGLLVTAMPFAAEGASLFDFLTNGTKQETENRYEKLDLILMHLENQYNGELDYDALIEGAAAGMMYSLDDPYSYYSPPANHDAQVESLTGQYAGIGTQIMVDAATHKPIVMRVFKDTGAEAAGIKKGDIIFAIDDTVPENDNLDAAAKMMRGEPGTAVKITLMRGDQLLSMDVTRGQTYSNSVEYQLLDGGVGYIIVYEFISDTAKEFGTALDNLLAEGMQGLIIDLRANGGGELQNCLAIADMLVPEGVLMSRTGKSIGEVVTRSDDKYLDIPLAVLIDGNSASASEILAGAIKDHDAGTLVGKTSFGKGVVQYLLSLPDGDFINFTAEEYFLPGGESIHGIGIEPDVEVDLDGEYTVTYRRIFDQPLTEDTQFMKALEIVQEEMGQLTLVDEAS